MLYIFFLFHQNIYTYKNNSVVPKLESVCSSSRKNWCNLLKIYSVLTISRTEKVLDFLLPFFSFVRLLFLLYILETKFTCLFFLMICFASLMTISSFTCSFCTCGALCLFFFSVKIFSIHIPSSGISVLRKIFTCNYVSQNVKKAFAHISRATIR